MADIGRSGWRNVGSSMPWPARLPRIATTQRSGASDEDLAERWVVAMRGKRAGHGIDDPSFLQPDRPMSAIGG